MRVLALVLLLATACGPAEETSSPRPTATPNQDPTVNLPITGAVTEVELDGNTVASFVVHADGQDVEILIDPERDYGFNLRHLEEHQASGDPVAVDIEVRGQKLYATSIEDA